MVTKSSVTSLKTGSPRSSDGADLRLGERIRLARLTAGLSQGELGAAIGVSSQQIQKYENGANRISASRLMRLASAVNIDIRQFFPSHGRSYGPTTAYALATPEATNLLAAFSRIEDRETRARVVALVETLAAK